MQLAGRYFSDVSGEFVGSRRQNIAVRDVPDTLLRRSTLLQNFIFPEGEYPFRIVDGRLGTSVRVAQESLRSDRMRSDARIAARHRLSGGRAGGLFSKGDKRAAQPD